MVKKAGPTFQCGLLKPTVHTNILSDRKTPAVFASCITFFLSDSARTLDFKLEPCQSFLKNELAAPERPRSDVLAKDFLWLY